LFLQKGYYTWSYLYDRISYQKWYKTENDSITDYIVDCVVVQRKFENDTRELFYNVEVCSTLAPYICKKNSKYIYIYSYDYW